MFKSALKNRQWSDVYGPYTYRCLLWQGNDIFKESILSRIVLHKLHCVFFPEKTNNTPVNIPGHKLQIFPIEIHDHEIY